MSPASGALERFDPSWPVLAVDPYPVYDRYRETEPVHWGAASNPRLAGSWYLFRYDDCVAALADPRLASDPASVGMAQAFPPAFAPVARVFLSWLGALDAPDHTRVRSVMAKAFTPRRVRALRPRIRALATGLLSTALHTCRSSGQPFDLVRDYAFPLPMAVIGDMLGVPEPDREQFRELSVRFAEALDNPGDQRCVTEGGEAARQMLDYFREQLAIRRARPTDDLMSAMLAATNEHGQAMTEHEILAEAVEMIVAGHETTVNTVARATHGLLAAGRWSEVASSRTEFTGPPLEELLRWVTPAQRERNRWVSEPMRIGGRQLAVGDAVVVMLGAANHDPTQFPRPHELDLTRPHARHLTFGHGPHMCLGAALARLEVGTAMDVLTELAPTLRLAAEVRWRNNTMIPGPATLPVALPYT